MEAVIALSIVFVAKEILRSRGRSPSTQPSLAERQPWLVAFANRLIDSVDGEARVMGRPTVKMTPVR